jgi:hypothetical protein
MQMADDKVQTDGNDHSIRVTSEPPDGKRDLSEGDSAAQSKPVERGAKPGRKPLFRS